MSGRPADSRGQPPRIDTSPSGLYICKMVPMNTSPRRLLFLGWLALLISLVITGDRVVDLMFEEPRLASASEETTPAEEPDNAAEHILMRSHKAESPAGISLSAGILLEAQACSFSFSALGSGAVRTISRHERPPRSSAVPLLLPLRI